MRFRPIRMEETEHLERKFSTGEIVEDLKGIDDKKAPEPDGFIVTFWHRRTKNKALRVYVVERERERP